MPRERQPTFLLGTAVKITTMLNIDTATTALITIDDPTETEKVSGANMTRECDEVYTYTYQSDSNDEEGDYVATISITYGGYTAVVQSKFTLVEQE
jgi:hypothetical protein